MLGKEKRWETFKRIVNSKIRKREIKKILFAKLRHIELMSRKISYQF